MSVKSTGTYQGRVQILQSVCRSYCYYTFFRRKSIKFVEQSCKSLVMALCAVMGGDILLERAKQRLGIDEGQTTPCGRVSLERLEIFVFNGIPSGIRGDCRVLAPRFSRNGRGSSGKSCRGRTTASTTTDRKSVV